MEQLAQDPRFLGGQIGMLGVLQTWTRHLRYHPQVHYLVPALALAPDGKRWLVGNSDFLLHVKPLGVLFRAKFRAALRQTPRAGQVDARVWAKSWVVDCRPVGTGTSALKYLAPYIFRIALSNNRIEQVVNEEVTFRYTEGKTGAQKRATLPVDAFIGRFLAHVLLKGFVKVRCYGLLHPSKRPLLAEVRSILTLRQAALPHLRAAAALEPLVAVPDVGRCLSCGQPMQLVQTLPPKRPQARLVAMVSEPSIPEHLSCRLRCADARYAGWSTPARCAARPFCRCGKKPHCAGPSVVGNVIICWTWFHPNARHTGVVSCWCDKIMRVVAQNGGPGCRT